jgi:hypothetical protein
MEIYGITLVDPWWTYVLFKTRIRLLLLITVGVPDLVAGSGKSALWYVGIVP